MVYACERAHLLRVEVLPALSVELAEERHDAAVVHEVDERITDVTLVLEIDREIEEVVGPPVGRVNLLQEHRLSVLIWDIPDHDGRALVKSFGYLCQI